MIFYTNNFAVAQTDDSQFEFTTITGDEIETSSVAQQMLERIELSKKILVDLIEGKNLEKTEEQKFIDEQRKISQQELQVQLDRMNKDYEPFAPRNAFAGYLSGVNPTYHGIYWDQFNYVYEKVKIAKAAHQAVIDQGGTYQEALQEYVKYASMTRVEIIELNQELNIKYGFADADIQKDFDKFGKLPRTDELPINEDDPIIVNDSLFIKEEIVDATETDRTFNVSNVKYDKKCEKWDAKAQKFLSKGKGIPPGIAMKLNACGSDIGGNTVSQFFPPGLYNKFS
ncbi:MAG: hypothetical protein IIC67_06720 [Thaumarchaeota archaeon]|nr:hypothetical protein [Nitrososphaerota archaeon]